MRPNSAEQGQRGLGTCQFCGQRRVFRFGVGIFRHGYTMTEEGASGDLCPGSGHLPAELSTTVTQQWIAHYEQDASFHREKAVESAIDTHGAALNPDAESLSAFPRNDSPYAWHLWSYQLSRDMAKYLREQVLPLLGKPTLTEPRHKLP